MLTPKEEKTLVEVAKSIGAKPEHLHALIQFESGWNPRAKNPTSSAKGLIQFMDSTARDMGYKNSEEIILRHPTIIEQLKGPVKKYLAKYGPFESDQALFMSVFYPVARSWPPLRSFPPAVQNANPNIKTVKDYVDFVYRRWNIDKDTLARLKSGAVKTGIAGAIVAPIVGVGTYLYLKFKKA